MCQICVDPGVIYVCGRNIGHVSDAGGVGVFQEFRCGTGGGFGIGPSIGLSRPGAQS